MVNEKKSSLLYVLDILSQYTDSKHCLTYTQIGEKLKSLYDIDLERKAIARDIDILIFKGYDIIKRGNYGLYLATRKFEEGELLYLIDAIYSSKTIPTKYAKDLVEKLKMSKESFPGVEKTEEEKEFLKIFSFVCMLCFDVYMKKQVIEKLIDEHAFFKKNVKEAKKKDKQDNEKK